MSSVQEDAEPAATGKADDDVPSEPRESIPPDGQEDEELDPRVKDELDRLNTASENINKYEKAIGDEREKFKTVTDEAFAALNSVKKGRERSIGKARPYFDMRKRARKAHVEAQRSAQRYEKAFSMHKAAREMVAKAEVNVMAGRSQEVAPSIAGQESMAWMEVLNHATLKVMETEKERRDSEQAHLSSSATFSELEKAIHVLSKENKRSIKNAMPYFEQHAKYYLQLEGIKKTITKLDKLIAHSKEQYSSALSSLEKISNEIHESRDRGSSTSGDHSVSQRAAREAIDGASSPDCAALGERTDGVGAEVNVDAVLQRMTDMARQYSLSSESLDIDDDREGGASTPSLLDRLDKLDLDDSCSLTTTNSQDPENCLVITPGDVATVIGTNTDGDVATAAVGTSTGDDDVAAAVGTSTGDDDAATAAVRTSTGDDDVAAAVGTSTGDDDVATAAVRVVISDVEVSRDDTPTAEPSVAVEAPEEQPEHVEDTTTTAAAAISEQHTASSRENITSTPSEQPPSLADELSVAMNGNVAASVDESSES